jgi:hypothetical protein
MTPSEPARPAARRTRSTVLAVGLALIALVALVSACGSSTPRGTSGTSPSTGGSTKTSKREQAVKFAECIRANGDSQFADPNAAGEFVSGISVSAEVWQKAVDACKDVEPPGSVSGNRSPAQQKLALKFAQCIRSNGVKDFPDPANGQPLIDTTKIPSTNAPGGMSILHAAMQKCQPLLRLTLGGQ